MLMTGPAQLRLKFRPYSSLLGDFYLYIPNPCESLLADVLTRYRQQIDVDDQLYTGTNPTNDWTASSYSPYTAERCPDIIIEK